MRSLTSHQLQVAANVPRDIARMWFEPLNLGAVEASVNTPRRWAMWLAQLGHESGGFTRLTESFDYDPAGLMRVWPSRYTPALAEQHGRGPGKRAVHHKIANHVYGGRMGNRADTEDGFIFRGRGIVQLTGRELYTAAGTALGIDLVGDPDRARQPDVAARIAAWFWRTRNVNRHADAADVTGATRAINGGTNGLADRMERYQVARDALGAA
jgi:putative chitinase